MASTPNPKTGVRVCEIGRRVALCPFSAPGAERGEKGYAGVEEDWALEVLLLELGKPDRLVRHCDQRDAGAG